MSPSPPPRCRALLFDLDGTLVDSRRDIAAALNVALEAVGHAPLPLEAIVPMIGDGARTLVARALAHDERAGGGSGSGSGSGGRALAPTASASAASVAAEGDALLDEVAALFVRSYAERPVVHTALLPGAREALEVGLPAALVTNKPRAVSVLVLEALGVASAFGAVFAGGDGPLKPSPDGVRAAAAALGVPIEGAWMIGDGPQDILAGRAAGCFTIAVPGIADLARVLAADPHLVVASLHDVARLARASLTSA
ncbi:MAG: HAD hydrolase-like protein [Labilithrix sp.]|nr:HAD hydrolase-like protein [Labilithrix sp.]